MKAEDIEAGREYLLDTGSEDVEVHVHRGGVVNEVDYASYNAFVHQSKLYIIREDGTISEALPGQDGMLIDYQETPWTVANLRPLPVRGALKWSKESGTTPSE